jgi:Protein of unknown function (DUF2490)
MPAELRRGRIGFPDARGAFAVMLFRLILMAPFLFVLPLRAQNQYQFWPEVDTYVNLSTRSRLFFLGALSSDQDNRTLDGEFGVNLDLYFRRFLQERLHNAKDPAKSKFLSLRVGYRYLPSLRGDNPNEQRPILELTARRLLPLAILFSDRNRVDFRFVEGKPFFWRYRNRVTFERNFSIHEYEFTPYVRGEFFYDSRYDKIDKNIFTLGSVFPLSKRTEFETYYEDQRDSSTAPNYHTRGIGLVLNLYF